MKKLPRACPVRSIFSAKLADYLGYALDWIDAHFVDWVHRGGPQGSMPQRYTEFAQQILDYDQCIFVRSARADGPYLVIAGSWGLLAKKAAGPRRDSHETTILNFRYLLERHELTKAIFAVVAEHLAAKGELLRGGTIVDATLIAASP